MDQKSVLYKCIEVGATVTATVVMVPILLGLVVVTFVGAVIYIPFHLWTVVKQSLEKP